jgi:serine/threonine protein phosphatase 1
MRGGYRKSLQMDDSTDRAVPSGFGISKDVRLYAVGDIHGRADLLEKINRKIDTHLQTNACARHLRIFLGDYVDRGPDSRGVIESLIAIEQQTEAVFLRGNHETFIPEFINKPAVLPTWRSLGGLETMASYGVFSPLNPDPQHQLRLAAEFSAAIPSSHLQFLNRLMPFFAFDGVFFAHAGVRPGVPLSSQSDTDLFWIRDEFLQHRGLFEKIVVHGHTPVRTPDVQPNRINIDTGAYVTGQLTCLWIQGNRMGFL